VPEFSPVVPARFATRSARPLPHLPQVTWLSVVGTIPSYGPVNWPTLYCGTQSSIANNQPYTVEHCKQSAVHSRALQTISGMCVCLGHVCFPHQYHNRLQLKLQTRNNTQTDIFQFIHFINKGARFIHSFHWHVQNATIPCRSQELLPFVSVMYVFPASLLHQLFFHPLSPHLANHFLVYLKSCCFQIHI
jgi:hypothetical protein